MIKEHDKIGTRLGLILTKLNNGEKVSIQELAEEFGEVSKPGIYFPNNDFSLTELLSTSGLNKLTANAKKISLFLMSGFSQRHNHIGQLTVG